MEILFLTTVLPAGRTSGGEIASQALIDALRGGGHDVTVLGYRRPGDRTANRGDEVAVAERAIETSSASAMVQAGWLASALARRLPYSVAKYRSSTYKERVEQQLAHSKPDVAILDHGQMGWLAPELAVSNVRTVVCAHNVEHRLYATQASEAHPPVRWLYSREARRVKRLEDGVARSAAAVWTFTEDDRAYFVSLGAEVTALALASGFEPPALRPAKRCDVALIGTWTWSFARRALEWFVDRVAPLLPPGLTIEVAGRGGEWLEQRAPAVTYRGFVPDACDFMAGARVVAVPGLGNTGVQVKTLDAIASGSLVVASADALRGIDDPPQSVTVATSAEQFAASLTGAIQAPPSSETSAEAIEWTRRRRDRFAADVDAALRASAG